MQGHQVAVGFQAEDDGVEEDDADDEVLDARGFDPFGEAESPGGYVLALAQLDQVRFAHGFKIVVFELEESIRGRIGLGLGLRLSKPKERIFR